MSKGNPNKNRISREVDICKVEADQYMGLRFMILHISQSSLEIKQSLLAAPSLT